MSRSALLVIDMQAGFLYGSPGAYKVDELVGTVAALRQRARDDGVPVVYLQHDGASGHPTEVGSDGWLIVSELAPLPSEQVVRKRSVDGFHDTELDERLRAMGVDRLIVTGFATELCVDTTCRRGITAGYDVVLVRDGHSTIDAGPPEHPAPDVRINWTNHVLSKLINHDRGVEVEPAKAIAFS
jgi:nicotinamidase-related amidase